MKAILHHGDAIEVLRQQPEDSVDSLVTDGPYGIRFMGKAWDGADIEAQVQRRARRGRYIRDGRQEVGFGIATSAGTYDLSPQGSQAFQLWTHAWAVEAFRVLKPGAHLLSFCSTRTSHRMVCGIEDAGFEIRDTIHWTFGSGFPKSLNLDGAWNGWGTALKPAHEHIVLARKPLPGTVADNVAKHGVGALNIQACRVGDAGATTRSQQVPYPRNRDGTEDRSQSWARTGHAVEVLGFGRWPPNMLLTHSANCKRRGTKIVKGDGHTPATRGESPLFGPRTYGGGFAGQDSLEERHFTEEAVDDYDCAQDCPVRLLDEQSGPLKSGGTPPNRPYAMRPFAGRFGGNENPEGIGSSEGTASRFFPTTTWTEDDLAWVPFIYQAKASRSEREGGLSHLEPRRFAQSGGAQGAMAEGEDYDEAQGIGLNRIKEVRNHHPTVKPLALMEWLVRLVTPPGGIVWDPFTGSGTTACAAVRQGFRFIGSELDPDYVTIARARIAYHSQPLLHGVPRPERSLADFLQETNTMKTDTEGT